MQILLISNSGYPFLEHCRDAMAAFLNGKRLTFISAAAYDDEIGYFERVRQALSAIGLQVEHLHTDDQPQSVLQRAEALFVGGGNTYHLLRRLQDAALLEPIQRRVRDGLPYIGASAGSNIAGPNILTTNDWNVDGMKNFTALALVPFNINPHYVGKSASDAPFSETREERIQQFHVVHENPVVGIEEQTWLQCDGDSSGRLSSVRVGGRGKVWVFRRGEPVGTHAAGAQLVF